MKEKYVVSVYNSKYRRNLIKFLRKMNIHIKFIDEMADPKRNLDDKYIYRNIYDRYVNPNRIHNSNSNSNRNDMMEKQIWKAGNYLRLIRESRVKISRGGTYLDIGCEDCEMPRLIGEGIGAKRVKCINIDEWSGSYGLNRSGCDFEYYNGVNIPLKANSVDVLSLFMTLHHVKDINGLISNIYRVMKPNGVLLINEHNVGVGDRNDNNRLIFEHFLDIIHYLYDLYKVKSSKDIMGKYDTTHYYSKDEMIKIIENKKYGFKLRSVYENPKSNIRSIFYVFTKN